MSGLVLSSLTTEAIYPSTPDYLDSFHTLEMIYTVFQSINQTSSTLLGNHLITHDYLNLALSPPQLTFNVS